MKSHQGLKLPWKRWLRSFGIPIAFEAPKTYGLHLNQS
jgi:hypothetical protein